jgi:hypothetical protein
MDYYSPDKEKAELEKYRQENDLTPEGCRRRMEEFEKELGPRRDLKSQLGIPQGFLDRQFTR